MSSRSVNGETRRAVHSLWCQLSHMKFGTRLWYPSTRYMSHFILTVRTFPLPFITQTTNWLSLYSPRADQLRDCHQTHSFVGTLARSKTADVVWRTTARHSRFINRDMRHSVSPFPDHLRGTADDSHSVRRPSVPQQNSRPLPAPASSTLFTSHLAL